MTVINYLSDSDFFFNFLTLIIMVPNDKALIKSNLCEVSFVSQVKVKVRYAVSDRYEWQPKTSKVALKFDFKIQNTNRSRALLKKNQIQI